VREGVLFRGSKYDSEIECRWINWNHSFNDALISVTLPHSMHHDYQRFLSHRRILRWLLHGVLPLLLLGLFIVPAFNGVAPRDPWIHQRVQLKFNHRFILDYRAQNSGHWPATFADLSSAVTPPDAQDKPRPFRDPDTGQTSPWLLFDPAQVKPLPEHGRIIAAAPRTGDSRKAPDQNRRIVLFEDSVVLVIPEADFRAATGR
jgi:hypothetical protein